MKVHKICFFNRGSIHYRTDIYLLLERYLDVDFYFGDVRPGRIKPIENNKLQNYKGTLHNINIGSFYWQKGVLPLLKSDYTDFITTGDPNCISTWIFIFLSKFYRKNVYLWTHGAYGREKSLKKKLIKWRMGFVKGVFLYGNYAKEILLKWGVPSDKLHVIYNSLGYDAQFEERQKLTSNDIYINHFHNNAPVLFFIGRLIYDKQLHRVIDAVAELKKAGQEVNLVLIGEGEAKLELKKQVLHLQIESQVWFYGACYDEHINAELIYNADLCVTPGPIGLTAMHSMMFGTPVITHNDFSHQGPEFEAIIEGSTGCFYKYNDTVDLVKKIKYWLQEHPNREDIRLKCYEVIDKKYNPHIQLETFRKVIINS